MAIVNDRQNAGKPTPVDPKTGKPLPQHARPASPEVPSTDSSTGFFSSFFSSRANKKKMAAMESPPPTLKASGALSEREATEVEVISMFIPWILGDCNC